MTLDLQYFRLLILCKICRFLCRTVQETMFTYLYLIQSSDHLVLDNFCRQP